MSSRLFAVKYQSITQNHFFSRLFDPVGSEQLTMSLMTFVVFFICSRVVSCFFCESVRLHGEVLVRCTEEFFGAV